MTHQRQHLPACDRVIVLRGGRIAADGSFAELQARDIAELRADTAAELDDAAYDQSIHRSSRDRVQRSTPGNKEMNMDQGATSQGAGTSAELHCGSIQGRDGLNINSGLQQRVESAERNVAGQRLGRREDSALELGNSSETPFGGLHTNGLARQWHNPESETAAATQPSNSEQEYLDRITEVTEAASTIMPQQQVEDQPGRLHDGASQGKSEHSRPQHPGNNSASKKVQVPPSAFGTEPASGGMHESTGVEESAAGKRPRPSRLRSAFSGLQSARSSIGGTIRAELSRSGVLRHVRILQQVYVGYLQVIYRKGAVPDGMAQAW